MSDSNLTSLYFAEESTFNEAPDMGSTLKEIRWVGDSLKPVKGTLESAEIRQERDLREIIKVSETSEGGVNCELVAGDYSPLIEAAMMGTWVTSTDSVTGTFDSGAQTFTLDSGSFSANIQGARLIRIANAATSGHNGVHRIVSITSTVITFKAGTITASDASDAVDLTYNYVRNANTERSFLFEKKYESAASDFYLAFSGYRLNEMTFSAEPDNAVMFSFDGMGGRISDGSATFGDGSPTAPTTNPIIDASNGIDEILVNGTANDCVNKFTFTASNSLREQKVVGSLFPKSHGKGRFLVNGQLDLYFENSTTMAAFLDHTSHTLQIVMSDSSSNTFSCYMPSVTYTDDNLPTEALDSDIIEPLAFSAKNGGTSNPYALQIDYVAAS